MYDFGGPVAVDNSLFNDASGLSGAFGNNPYQQYPGEMTQSYPSVFNGMGGMNIQPQVHPQNLPPIYSDHVLDYMGGNKFGIKSNPYNMGQYFDPAHIGNTLQGFGSVAGAYVGWKDHQLRDRIAKFGMDVEKRKEATRNKAQARSDRAGARAYNARQFGAGRV